MASKSGSAELLLIGIPDVHVKTSSKHLIIFGLALFLMLFVGGGAWAYFINLSGAVVTSGQVVVLGKPKTIQHLDGGIVAAINVDNGDRVLKGQILIELDDTQLMANLNIYQNRLREALAQQARLLAERDQIDQIIWQDKTLVNLAITDDPVIKQGQQKLFEARRATTTGQISQMKEKIAQFENQLKGMRAQETSKTMQMKLLDEELKGVKILADKGIATKSRLLAMAREREEIAGQVGEFESEQARIRNSISETEIQILQIDREFRQSVLTELRQVEQEVNDTTQQLSATIDQLKRIDIRTPVSGIVHELNVFTIGGVIGAGTPIMQIIPQDGEFEVEANIEPKFVDDILRGQEAQLKFSAFNQRTTPELAGIVSSVSPNVVVDQQTGKSFYRVRIAVSDKEINKFKGHPLISGMPVEVFIKTHERTALNYLVKPLMDQVNRAFREE